jgi:hypothetical protein
LDIEVTAMVENGAACQNSSIRRWATSKRRRGDLQMVSIKNRMVVISKEEDESSQPGNPLCCCCLVGKGKGAKGKVNKNKGRAVKSGTSDTRKVGSLVGPSLKSPIENDPANVSKSVVKRYSCDTEYYNSRHLRCKDTGQTAQHIFGGAWILEMCFLRCSFCLKVFPHSRH